MKQSYLIIVFVLVCSIVITSSLNYAYSSHFADEEFWEKKYKKLIKETKELRNEVDNLKNEIVALEITSNAKLYELQHDADFWKNEYDKSFEYGNELYEEFKKPKTVIEGTEIKWSFQDSKGNSYSWSMPVKTYEDLIIDSKDKSIRHQYDDLRYLITDEGREFTTVNFDGFAKKSFSKVIDNVYDNSKDNSDFIWEVWYIVSQLTVYDEDVTIASEGRFALETFSRGGGDCEDLVILIADMLMSSKHTDDWKFQYVSLDIDNPLDPNEVNHLVLRVSDGEYSYYIEATGEPRWDYYPDGISGWSFDVV